MTGECHNIALEARSWNLEPLYYRGVLMELLQIDNDSSMVNIMHTHTVIFFNYLHLLLCLSYLNIINYYYCLFVVSYK